jgi:hypothetical protein
MEKLLALVFMGLDRPIHRQKITPKPMKSVSKTTLAVVAIGVLSCTLFSEGAQATPIQGNISFAGSVQFGTSSLAAATRVVTWFDTNGNTGFSTVVPGATGGFAGIPAGTQATMAQPWIFDP